MPKIRVTKAGGFKYGLGADRQQYNKGDELIVKQKEARLYVAARLASLVDDTTPAPKPRAQAASAKTGKRTYNRRDMKAK